MKKHKTKYWKWLIIIILIGSSSVYIYQNRKLIKNYITANFKKLKHKSSDLALNKGIDKFAVHGIDVSEYQGNIKWKNIGKIHAKYPVEFVFIRSTCGHNKKDCKFDYNWENAKEKGLIRGAYHYYRPNENSEIQAKNFIKNVKLEKGDLPPVLDIESHSKVQSTKKLITGLKNWCNIIEDYYGVKPIIYCTEGFFNWHFKEDFKDHILWIGKYNKKYQPSVGKDWNFWQHSEKAKVEGYSYHIDANVFNGSIEELKELCIK